MCLNLDTRELYFRRQRDKVTFAAKFTILLTVFLRSISQYEKLSTYHKYEILNFYCYSYKNIYFRLTIY